MANTETRTESDATSFRTLVDSLEDVVVVGATDGRIRHVNGAACRVLGYAPEACRAMRVRDLHPDSLGTEVDAILTETVATGRVEHALPLIAADGRRIHARGRTWTAVWDAEPCIVNLYRDVTASVEAETWFESLFRNNPAPMALTSLDDRTFLDVNDAFLSVTGYARDEVIGRTSTDLNLFLDGETQAAAAKQLRARGTIAATELRLRRKDGQILSGLFYGELVKTKARTLALTVMVDITDRRLAENALARSEERLRLALDAANDGIWDWDIVAGTGLWNARCYTMLGYEENAFPVTFQAWVDLMHPEDRGPAAEAIEHSLRAGESFATEFRLQRQDGTWLWVLGRGRPVAWTEAGEPTRMVGTNTDIDDRKRLEQSLIQARNEAEAANRAKSEFLANMSHELRTPLNSIIGFSSTLLEPALADPSGARTPEYLRFIKGAGEHLLDLINDVLDLSAIEADQVVLVEGPMDVREVCDACLTMARPLADRGGVAVSVDIPEATPMLRADGRRVRQILANLVSNAVKFTRAGGTVSVSSRLEDDGGLSLVVTDTGVGIEPSALDALMTPFGQAEPAYVRRTGGVGLGLPLTARLMELHGGTLTLDSALDQGTAATVTFPAWRVLTPRPGR
ncbi:PAS domain S-box protein [uncultured Rhodospira sp.]|uniref:sensor histidine kinase n=1 Tax=uncultured Rhodospira sp. TaxID=1936189 RepID=UPI002616EE04|nr:PAS domain S-box protein [uncultured Rhodospira sp.]